MCVYCMVADWGRKVLPVDRWTRPHFDEFQEILRRIKKLEDAQGGCPDEDPTKTDFLDDIRRRLDELEGKP